MNKIGDDVELSPTLNDGFDQPQEISPARYAFPANLGELLPAYSDIPAEFKSIRDTDWGKFVTAWFYTGWPTKLVLFKRDDVDGEAAIKHLSTILRSYEPKHEHKMAAVSWLLSRWFGGVGTVESVE